MPFQSHVSFAVNMHENDLWRCSFGNFRNEGHCTAFTAFFTILYGHLHKYIEKNNENETRILSLPIFDTRNSHREVRTFTP
jgi:hypothetical protein